jgi:hypothetical protein
MSPDPHENEADSMPVSLLRTTRAVLLPDGDSSHSELLLSAARGDWRKLTGCDFYESDSFGSACVQSCIFR